MKFSKLKMKRVFAAVTSVAIISSLATASAFAVSTEQSPYGEYDNFNEVYTAYMEAIDNNDLEKQAELLEIARTSLDNMIEESHQIASQNATPYAARGVFSDYFSAGYWETRDNGVCLTLMRTGAFFDLTPQITEAWNLTYARFGNDPEWDNTDIMEEQFFCHARFIYGVFERVWNLEPWKTSINPITCN